MKRIAIDMDGVIADVTEQFIKWHKQETGIIKTIEELNGKTDREAFPNVRKWVYTEGFFRTLKVMPNSQEVLKKINEKYELFIVSAATEFPQSLIEKQAWLNEHFDFITWQNMVFCGSKTIIQADIMIDDHFKNLDHFHGETFLFTATHNALSDAGRHRRVHTWKEIADILL